MTSTTPTKAHAATCIAPPGAQPGAASHAYSFPPGAWLRVRDFCRDEAAGRPGLLPIAARTWAKWVSEGKVPPGRLLGTRTRVWTVDEVLAVARGLADPAAALDAEAGEAAGGVGAPRTLPERADPPRREGSATSARVLQLRAPSSRARKGA
jgi:hypothetical protein